jgi:hypothetical protein
VKRRNRSIVGAAFAAAFFALLIVIGVVYILLGAGVR